MRNIIFYDVTVTKKTDGDVEIQFKREKFDLKYIHIYMCMYIVYYSRKIFFLDL